MSKGGGSKPAPVKQDTGDPFISGFVPFPAGGQFPIVPPQNYWEGGKLMSPGQAQPIMGSELLVRFPQLAAAFGGRTPVPSSGNTMPSTVGGQQIQVGQAPTATRPPTTTTPPRGGKNDDKKWDKRNPRGVLETGAALKQGLLGWNPTGPTQG